MGKYGCVLDPGTLCKDREPLMADDGSGSDITIPVMVMFKQDVDTVKVELDKGVWVQMAWSVPNPDDHVEYDLWSKVYRTRRARRL